MFFIFKLRSKRVHNGGRWIVQIICENHELIDIIKYPYASKLRSERYMLLDVHDCLMKFTNILLTLKQNIEDNAINIKKVYNVRYVYERYKEDQELKCNT